MTNLVVFMHIVSRCVEQIYFISVWHKLSWIFHPWWPYIKTCGLCLRLFHEWVVHAVLLTGLPIPLGCLLCWSLLFGFCHWVFIMFLDYVLSCMSNPSSCMTYMVLSSYALWYALVTLMKTMDTGYCVFLISLIVLCGGNIWSVVAMISWVLTVVLFTPLFVFVKVGVGCGGHHRQRGKNTTGSVLDGAALDFTQILAYLVHNMSRFQLYLGCGHFGWLLFSVNNILAGFIVKLYFICWNYSLSPDWHITA